VYVAPYIFEDMPTYSS